MSDSCSDESDISKYLDSDSESKSKNNRGLNNNNNGSSGSNGSSNHSDPNNQQQLHNHLNAPNLRQLGSVGEFLNQTGRVGRRKNDFNLKKKVVMK